jgi:hypothetical protein
MSARANKVSAILKLLPDLMPTKKKYSNFEKQ